MNVRKVTVLMTATIALAAVASASATTGHSIHRRTVGFAIGTATSAPTPGSGSSKGSQGRSTCAAGSVSGRRGGVGARGEVPGGGRV